MLLPALAAVAAAASAPLAMAATSHLPTLRFNTTFSPFDGLFQFSSDKGHNATWRNTWDGKGRYAGSDSSPNVTFAFEGTGIWIHGYGAVPDHVATLSVDGRVFRPNIATHISQGFAGCGSVAPLAFGLHDVFFTFPIGGVNIDGVLVETEISSAETSIDTVPRRVELTHTNGQRNPFFAADDLWKQHDEGLELDLGAPASSATLAFQIPKGVGYAVIHGSVGPRYADGELHFDPPLPYRPSAVVPYYPNGTLPRRGVLWAGNLDSQQQYSVSLRPSGHENVTVGKVRVYSVTMLLTEKPLSKSSISIGAVVGGVLGGIVFLGVVGVLLRYHCRLRTRQPPFEIEASDPIIQAPGAPLSIVSTLPEGHSPTAESTRTARASDSSWMQPLYPSPVSLAVTKERPAAATPNSPLPSRVSPPGPAADKSHRSAPLPRLGAQNESQDSVAPMLGGPARNPSGTQSIPHQAANRTTLQRLAIPNTTSPDTMAWPQPGSPTSPLSPTDFDPNAEVTVEIDAEDAAAEILARGNNSLPPYWPANDGITRDWGTSGTIAR